MLVPQIFGKNSRYASLIILSFWSYYTWLTNFSLEGLLLLFVSVCYVLYVQILADDLEDANQNAVALLKKDKWINTIGFWAIFLNIITPAYGLYYVIYAKSDQWIFLLSVINLIYLIYMILKIIKNKEQFLLLIKNLKGLSSPPKKINQL